MNVAAWIAIVGPVTTLLGSLGGYWLAGRGDEARDRRAAAREDNARRAALSERLEEERHVFQRDTLLQLQDELQKLLRITGQINWQDQRAIGNSGNFAEISDHDGSNGAVRATVARLATRLLDDDLRAAVNKFAKDCAEVATHANMMRAVSEQPLPDHRRHETIRQLQSTIVGISLSFGDLAELLGGHLRRELDRRNLMESASTTDDPKLDAR